MGGDKDISGTFLIKDKPPHSSYYGYGGKGGKGGYYGGKGGKGGYYGGNGNKGTENVYFVDCGDKCLANPLELGPACKELSKKQNDVTKDSSICVVYIDKKTNKPDFAKPFPKQLPLYYTSDTGVEYEAEIQTSCSLPLISPWATVVVESGKGVKVPTVPINLETGKDLPSNIVLAFTGGITTGAYRAAKRAERYNEAGFELDPEKCGCECTPTSV